MTTSRRSRANPAVSDFILRHAHANPATIGTLAAKEFGLSRAAINNYVHRLVDSGLLLASGRTNARRYSLNEISRSTDLVEIIPGLAEHDVWRKYVEPNMKDVKSEVVDICYYGFTEMFNNIIDHSGSATALVSYIQDYNTITMMVSDDGIGIFEKIQKDFKLDDPRTALLELSKGKLTSDKSKHSGEGIFFTSRMFNDFNILSGHLGCRRIKEDDWGWLIETENLFEYQKGTVIRMRISTAANWTAKEVFRHYDGEERSFAKTHVPIMLGKYGSEQLISRSQAKRILARFDKFEEVFLDFQGVAEIGQAFADEIFRVFKNVHPEIKIVVINTTPDIDRMIAHVTAADRDAGG